MTDISLEDGEDQHLRAAIENLYLAFSRYPPRGLVVNCSPRIGKGEETGIARKPLRQYTEKDFEWFEFNSMTLYGDEGEFKHFLPRVLELVAHGKIDPNFLNKLNSAQWRNWPEAEQNTVETYLLCVWRQALKSSDDDFYKGAHLLKAIVDVTDNMQPFLELWEQSCSCTTLHHLSDCIQFYSVWWLCGPNPVGAWLLDPATIEKFEQRYFENLHESYADELAATVDCLNRLQR